MTVDSESLTGDLPQHELVVHIEPDLKKSEANDPVLRQINSADGKRRALLIPCFKLTVRLEFILGLLLVASQLIVSVLILTSSDTVAKGYSMDKGFPGVWAGLAVIAFACFARRVSRQSKQETANYRRDSIGLVYFSRRVSMKAHLEPGEAISEDAEDLPYLPWRGMAMSRTLLIASSIGTMALLLFGLTCSIVGLLESTVVLQATSKEETFGSVLGITAMQAFAIASFGLLALFLTIQTITTAGIFGDHCCKNC